MSERLKIGADDPDIGRLVADAHEKRAVMDASPRAAKVGAALAIALAWVALAAAVCAFLALLWVMIRLAGSL